MCDDSQRITSAGDGGHREEHGVHPLKSDQENPVKAVQREFAARRRDMRVVENAVQRVIGLTRGVKDALEANIQQMVEPNKPVMIFMVNHAATIINRVSVDQDGKTPMEKARGTTVNREMTKFGKKVLFQPVTKYSKGNAPDVRWQYGLFMGVATRTNKVMESGLDGNERAWTFRRLSEDKR